MKYFIFKNRETDYLYRSIEKFRISFLKAEYYTSHIVGGCAI